jgi:hypothetical protein
MSKNNSNDLKAAGDKVSEAIQAVQVAFDQHASDEAAAAEEAKRVRSEGLRLAHELLFSSGLYENVDLTGAIGAIVNSSLRQNSFRTDAYCVSCKRETSFAVYPSVLASRGIDNRPGEKIVPPNLLSINAVCQRDSFVYNYIIKFDSNKATKIGQYPSLADIAFGELRSIDRALDPIDRRELGRALGLYAHDTAIGAFVYLRRVFERMIMRAHQRFLDGGGKVDDFDSMRMDQRINALKSELPEKIVKNSNVFSILSVGLHELNEEQCLKYFPVIKAVIFQMLEAEEHKRKAALTDRDTDSALQKILLDISTAEGKP